MFRLPAVLFGTLSRTLPQSQLKWIFSARVRLFRMATNPLVRSKLWLCPLSRIWSRPSNSERRRTVLPGWTTQKAEPRRSVSQRTWCAARTCVSSQHSRCLNCCTQSSSGSGRAGGQKPAHRQVFGCATTSIEWTLDMLEVEPPDADQQELLRATTPSSRTVHRAKARHV